MVEVQCKGVEYYKAPDGRTVAMVVRDDFDAYASFPPYLTSAEERAHLREAYAGSEPEVERNAKAHITDDELPIQIVLLRRGPGAVVKPHYHRVEERPRNTTRHQILLCKSGALRIGVYTKEGIHVDTVDLGPGDLILMYEGHSIEFLKPGTRAVEIKEGPFPETDERDKVELR